MINNELYHFGIKGMKWGVRRYERTKNGKLSSAAKNRMAYKAKGAASSMFLGNAVFGKARYAGGEYIGTKATDFLLKYTNLPWQISELPERFGGAAAVAASTFIDAHLGSRINSGRMDRMYGENYGYDVEERRNRSNT